MTDKVRVIILENGKIRYILPTRDALHLLTTEILRNKPDTEFLSVLLVWL